MEFKVIFIGFALHCVLNTVLICKSVITKGQEAHTETAIAQQEQEMFQVMSEGEDDVKRLNLQVDNSSKKGIISLKR